MLAFCTKGFAARTRGGKCVQAEPEWSNAGNAGNCHYVTAIGNPSLPLCNCHYAVAIRDRLRGHLASTGRRPSPATRALPAPGPGPRAAQLGRYVLLRLRRRAGEHRACAGRQPLRARPDAALAGHACRGWPGLCRLTCPETSRGTPGLLRPAALTRLSGLPRMQLRIAAHFRSKLNPRILACSCGSLRTWGRN